MNDDQKTSLQPGTMLRVTNRKGLIGYQYSPDPWEPIDESDDQTKNFSVFFGDLVMLCKPLFKSSFGLITLAVLHPVRGKICLNFSAEEIKKNLEIVGVDEDDK